MKKRTLNYSFSYLKKYLLKLFIYTHRLGIPHLKFLFSNRFLSVLAQSIPLVLLVIYISASVLNFGISNGFKFLFLTVFVVPTFYYLFSYFEFVKKNAQTNDKQFLLDKSKYFNSSISLLLFYSTLFIGLLIFQDKPQVGEIPNLGNDGLIGIRSWQSNVCVKKIKIRYQNISGNWITIPDTIIYNERNWIEVKMDIDKLNDDINKISWFKKKRIRAKESFSNVSDSSIIVQNSVLIFYPKMYNRIYHNIRFDCDVIFMKINKPKNKLYPGFQILFFIDSAGIGNNQSNLEISKMFLQFNLGMNNDHHPWIPGLDYRPPVKYISPINKRSKYGNFSKMNIGDSYSISAIIFDNKVLFLGNSVGSATLFEGEIANFK